MRSEEIEELLVDWELARQEGRLLTAKELSRGRFELQTALDTKIEILQWTAWMLSDPASGDAPSGSLDRLLSDQKPADRQPDVEASAADPGKDAIQHPSDASAENENKTLPMQSDESRTHEGEQQSPSGAKGASGRAGREDMLRLLSEAGFEVEKELGRGGFGIVYQAVDRELNRRVAVKVALFNNTKSDQRYLQEARNAALVEVDGLVPVLQVGRTSDGTPFVVQKLIEGETLADVLRRQGRLSPSQAVEWLSQVCRAVAMAHARSLVHRDLKPANILIDKRGQAWVADFGLAFTDDDLESREFHLSAIAGTPAYMAPEQLSEFVERLDGRCDLWALGVILYEVLSGKRPFRAREPQELREQICLHDPRPISQRRPELHRGWNEIFRRCCAKNAADRYANAYDLAADLEAVLKIQAAWPETLEAQDSASLSSSNPSLLANGIAAAADVLESPASGTDAAKEREPANKPAWPIRYLLAASLMVLVPALTVWMMAGKSGESNKDSSLIEQLAASEIDWIVAADGSGDFQTLAEAMEALQVDTRVLPKVELRIAPGDYSAAFEIQHDLLIRGIGPREDIVIRGLKQPAFQIRKQSRLELIGVTVRGDASSETNTIEVQDGHLQLKNCIVEASGFDCVRIEPEGGLIAEEETVFRVLEHPAVFAKRAAVLELRQCRFEFPQLDLESNVARVGLQVRQCGGLVAGCVFSATPVPGRNPETQLAKATGIDWGDTDAKVEIRDCSFEDLEIGLAGFNCGRLQIFSLSGRSSFSRCQTAIDLSECGGEVANSEIDGGSLRSGVGILISNQQESALTLRGTKVRDAERGIILNQAMLVCSLLEMTRCAETGLLAIGNSKLELSDSQISQIADIGILIEDSQASLKRVEVVDCGVAGIVVDGAERALQVEGGQLGRNRVGIILTSGSALLENTDIAGSDTGLLVSRKHMLKHQVTGDAALRIEVDGGTIQADLRAVQFLSSGAIRLRRCKLNDPDGGRIADGIALRSFEDGEWLEIERDDS